MDEQRRFQFAAWSAVVGLAAAALSVVLIVIDATIEGLVFGVIALVIMYVAMAGFGGWWPFAPSAGPEPGGPADPQ